MKKLKTSLMILAIALLSIAAAPTLQETNFTNLGLGVGSALDTWIKFDGNAQDYYLALDDSADDLILGLGTAIGTTPIISMDENQDSSFGGDITLPGVLSLDDTDSTDTGATAGGGALDLGQDDVAGFIFGDGVWIELFSPDNS